MPIANRSTSVRAKPTGLGQRSGDGVYDRGSNVAGPRADGGEQESLLAERRELGNNLGERKVESAWPGKATGRDTENATISMRTGFLVVGALPVMWWAVFNSVLPQAIFSSYSTKKRGSCRADACEVHCRDARSLQRDFQPRTKTQSRNRGPANWFPKRRLRAGY